MSASVSATLETNSTGNSWENAKDIDMLEFTTMVAHPSITPLELDLDKTLACANLSKMLSR